MAEPVAETKETVEDTAEDTAEEPVAEPEETKEQELSGWDNIMSILKEHGYASFVVDTDQRFFFIYPYIYVPIALVATIISAVMSKARGGPIWPRSLAVVWIMIGCYTILGVASGSW